jgi:hypothetical protein
MGAELQVGLDRPPDPGEDRHAADLVALARDGHGIDRPDRGVAAGKPQRFRDARPDP